MVSKNNILIGRSLFAFLLLGSPFSQAYQMENAMDQLGKGLEQLGEGLNQMTDSLNQGLEGLEKNTFPESQLILGHKNYLVKQPFKSLKVLLTSGDQIVIKTIAANEVPRIRVFAFADPNHKDRLDLLLKSIKFELNNDKLELSSNLNSNSCVQIRMNGQLSGSGSCYYQVIVELPEGSNIAVRDEEKVLNSVSVPFDKDEMISMIKSEMMSSKKLKVLENELKKNKPNPILGAEDVASILEEMMLDSDKKAAFALMIDYIMLNEAEAISDVIDHRFNFTSEKSAAHKMLLKKLQN